MTEPVKYLLEWAGFYAKHKDIYEKKIVDIKEDGDKLVIKRKEDVINYLGQPSLNKNKLKDFGKKDFITIVTFNTANNIEELLKGWHFYAEYPNLIIIFINPKSNLDTKWIIKPYLHQRICDEKALKRGLKSIYETVEPMKEKDIGDLES